MSRDLQETLGKFTEAKTTELAEKAREHEEAIKHHQSLFQEMKSKLDGEIAGLKAKIDELVHRHHENIVSITNAKNEDIANEKALHAATKEDLGGQISQLSGDLAVAKTRIMVCPISRPC